MTSAADFLDELHSRGITIQLEGNFLRCRAPKTEFTTELQQRLRAQKPALIAELRREDDQFPESTEESCAVLIRSQRYGHIWLVPDHEAEQQLVTELNGTHIPILTFEEARLLHGKSPEMLRALLTAKSAMPWAELIQ